MAGRSAPGAQLGVREREGRWRADERAHPQAHGALVERRLNQGPKAIDEDAEAVGEENVRAHMPRHRR